MPETQTPKTRTLEELRALVLSKRKGKSEFSLLDYYHTFMINYGYIPLKEFENLPLPVVLELTQKLKKMYEEQNKKSR
jgi:hypothetical protein